MPLHPLRPIALAFLLLSGAACGSGSDASSACGPITREALDSSYLVHVLDPNTDVDYTSDPPTSGPHAPAPVVEAVSDQPIPRPAQIGVLERGDVLIQHDPDLSADQRVDLEALGTTGVVIAPNPDLPFPVVATAWTYKLTCDEVDIVALREFIDERLGQGPD